MRVYLLVVIVLALCCVSAVASADAVAEQLYQDGKALLDAGKTDAACAKLAASFEREALSGTLITLGFCHEKQGKSATAWGEYNKAIVLAQREGRDRYVDSARQFAQAIEPTLSKLTITFAGAGTPTITLDDQPLPALSLGTALPVDPGQHHVSASQEGFHMWRGEISVGGNAARATLNIPALTPAPVAPVPPPAPSESMPLPGEPAPGVAANRSIPTWAWVVGGVGIVCLGVAAGFVADTLSASSELDDQCGDDRQTCPSLDDYDYEADFAREERSTALAVGFGIGAALGLGASIFGIAIGSSSDSAGSWRVFASGSTAGVKMAY